MEARLRRNIILALANLYRYRDDGTRISDSTGLDSSNIDISGTPKTYWNNILSEAEKQEKLYQLLETVLIDYPNDPDILVAKKALEQGFEENYAFIQANYVGFGILPVAFLELGVHRVKSVCRITINQYKNKSQGWGTGFLIKNDLLITAKHIIENKESAKNCIAEFEYEQTLNNPVSKSKQYLLEPMEFFLSSNELHLTVVKVQNNPSDEYPPLPLKKINCKTGENIITVHHRMGQPKQISMRDGPITYVDEKAIQYDRTIKSPGASGAPVFDLSWRVIGMHYSSLNPSTNLGEAIHINKIIKELEKAGQAS